jgi:hypothetical protein
MRFINSYSSCLFTEYKEVNDYCLMVKEGVLMKAKKYYE